MYVLKDEVIEEIKNKYRISYLTKNTGVTRQYISTIIHKGQACSGTIAIKFAKSIDKNLTDIFIKVY